MIPMALSKTLAQLLLHADAAWLGLTNPALSLTMDWYFTTANVIGGLPKPQAEKEFARMKMRLAMTLHKIGVSEEAFYKRAKRWFEIGKAAGWVVPR